MGLIAQWMASWEVYDTTVEEWTPLGDHVLLVVHRRARQRETGEQADTVAAQVWTLRDDLIVRIASYSDIDEARRVAGAAASSPAIQIDDVLAAAETLRGVAHHHADPSPRARSTSAPARTSSMKAENLQRGGAFKFRGAYTTASPRWRRRSGRRAW